MNPRAELYSAFIYNLLPCERHCNLLISGLTSSSRRPRALFRKPMWGQRVAPSQAVFQPTEEMPLVCNIHVSKSETEVSLEGSEIEKGYEFGIFVESRENCDESVLSLFKLNSDGQTRYLTSLYLARQDDVDEFLKVTKLRTNIWAKRSNSQSKTPILALDMTMGAEELNFSLKPDHLQRHRYVLAPDEAFGAIFTWDVVVTNARKLELKSWQVVAQDYGMAPPDLDDIVRAESMSPEAAISRVFCWTTDWGEITRAVRRKQEIFAQLELNFEWELSNGFERFLNSLLSYGVKCILCVNRPFIIIQSIIKTLNLESVFTKREIVSSDSDFDTLEEMFLISALKSQRPPEKCVVFTDKPMEISAGHEITSKVIALIGAHPAYEVKSADHVITDFNDLVVHNVRRLFSDCGAATIIDPQTEVEVEHK